MHTCVIELSSDLGWYIGSMWAGWREVGVPPEGWKQHGHVWAWLWNTQSELQCTWGTFLVLSINGPRKQSFQHIA